MDLARSLPRWLLRPTPPDRQTRTADESIHEVREGVHVREVGMTGRWLHYVGPADVANVTAPKNGE